MEKIAAGILLGASLARCYEEVREQFFIGAFWEVVQGVAALILLRSICPH